MKVNLSEFRKELINRGQLYATALDAIELWLDELDDAEARGETEIDLVELSRVYGKCSCSACQERRAVEKEGLN